MNVTEKKLKIIHVVPALTKGGGERVVAELANYSVKQGHEVTIIASYAADPKLLQNSLHKDIQIKFVSPSVKGRFNKYTNILGWLSKNEGWITQQDVVHLHLTWGTLFGAALVAYLKLKGKRVPVMIESVHGVGMKIPKWHRWMHSTIASRRDGLVMMNLDDYWKKVVDKHPKLLTRIIPNGISFANLDPLPENEKRAYKAQINIPDSCKMIVGTVSMLRPDRQPARYIPIFAEVSKAVGPSVHFVIVGEGPERPAVEALIREYGMEGIVHLPGLSMDTRQPFSIIDVYIAVNIGSITGMAGLEAAFRKVPVIAIQNYPDYKMRDSDWMWSSDDTSEISGKVISLLQDPVERSMLSEKQNQYVNAHYTTDAMGAAYEELYRKAILLRKRETRVELKNDMEIKVREKSEGNTINS